MLDNFDALFSLSGKPKHYFTVQEANATVPLLQHEFARLLQMHAQVKTLLRSLRTIDFLPTEVDFKVAPQGADEEVVDLLSSLKILLQAVQECIQDITDSGCVIQNLELGSVDWLSTRDGRDVFLTWQFGESAVTHWHEMDKANERHPISAAEDVFPA